MKFKDENMFGNHYTKEESCQTAKNQFNDNRDTPEGHIVNLGLEIVTGDNPSGEINIGINDVIALGYKDREVFEDEIMAKIAKIANRDVDDIKCLLKDKIRYKGRRYAT